MDVFEKIGISAMIFIVLTASSCGYMTHQNIKTGSQKSSYISSCDNVSCLKKVAAVSYNEHFYANIMQSDPLKLYSPSFQEYYKSLRN